MSSEIVLKQFQKDTVNEILNAFSKRDVFALADEVGLGKTLTCAEVAYNRILKADQSNSKEPIVIYYVAPAIELIEQNLKTIKRYLDKKFKHQRDIFTYSSRITKISCDIAEKDSKANSAYKKDPIHLIGLSPATSFKLRGAGMISERAYLAAFFGYNKSQESKKIIRNNFWCLGSKAEDRFLFAIDSFCDHKYLGPLDHIKDSEEYEKLYQELLNLPNSTKQSDQRKMVAKVRNFVAKEWIKKSKSVLVILDEWHKYKDTCFSEKLMKNFLDVARSGKKTKLLLVSATPFSVKYTDDEEFSSFDGSEDLKGLMQLFWGEGQYDEHYAKIKKHQEDFLNSAEEFLVRPSTNSEKLLGKARKSYENLLRQFCVRTERMRIPVKEVATRNEDSELQAWDSKVTISLSNFLSEFSNAENVRSPILSMWQDGHSFPEFKEYKIGKFNKKSISGLHWKTDFLKRKLDVSFHRQDKLHDFKHAPLWLYPKCPLKKYLIFSEFQFLTGEICRNTGFGVSKHRGMIDKIKIGYFPMPFMQGRRDRSSDTLEMKKNYHWLIFYPSLCFENPETIYLDNNSNDLIQKLGKIESFVAKNQQLLEFRRIARWELFDRKYQPQISKSAAEYFKLISKNSVGYKTIGQIIVNALQISGVFIKLPDPSDKASKDYLRKFEKALMNLGSSFLHLFSSDEALSIGQQAKKLKIIPKSLKVHNEHIAFAIWYSNEYQLEETLSEFSSTLLQNGFDPIDLVNEIAASVNLRKSSLGTRYVRPFNDKKSEEVASDSSGGAVDRRSLRTAFNSPFPPYALVTTSVGQEGLDFHRYCDSIIHWSPPGSPNSLKQREGRLDRYRSKQNRLALDKLGLKYPDLPESDRGLCPDFVVLDSNGKRANKSESYVLYLPFSAQEKKWHRCLERSYYNDLLIGAPDPMASEQRLQRLLETLSKEERVERLEKIQGFSINLRPPITK